MQLEQWDIKLYIKEDTVQFVSDLRKELNKFNP